jgi:hypothetical protein
MPKEGLGNQSTNYLEIKAVKKYVQKIGRI